MITFRRIENHYQGCPQAFQDIYNAPPPPPAPWAGDAAPLATPAPSNTGTDYSIVTDTVERDEPQREGGRTRGDRASHVISGIVPPSTPPPRHLLEREQVEDAESSGSMEYRSHDDVDMDALAANIAEDVAARFVPFEGEGRTLLEDAPPAPLLPQVMQDNRTSPVDSVPGEGDFVTQVQCARLFLDWCRHMINRYDDIQQQSTPEVRD